PTLGTKPSPACPCGHRRQGLLTECPPDIRSYGVRSFIPDCAWWLEMRPTPSGSFTECPSGHSLLRSTFSHSHSTPTRRASRASRVRRARLVLGLGQGPLCPPGYGRCCPQ